MGARCHCLGLYGAFLGDGECVGGVPGGTRTCGSAPLKQTFHLIQLCPCGEPQTFPSGPRRFPKSKVPISGSRYCWPSDIREAVICLICGDALHQLYNLKFCQFITLINLTVCNLKRVINTGAPSPWKIFLDSTSLGTTEVTACKTVLVACKTVPDLLSGFALLES